MHPQPTRTEKLDLRLSLNAKQVLQEAAVASSCSVSEFVLKSALTRAEETLADRRSFSLNPDQWKLFTALLDAPPRDLPQVKKLFQTTSLFEVEGD